MHCTCARAHLLYHCIVDIRVTLELSLAKFVEWSGPEVLAMVESWDGMAPGQVWSRYTASKVGFMDGHDISVIEVATEEERNEGGLKWSLSRPEERWEL